MTFREFRQSGHFPSLVSAFLHFDISFMVWVLLGALANAIAAGPKLSPTEKGLLVATPILGGAILRIVLGVLTDWWGARRTGLLGLAVTFVPLLLGWLWAEGLGSLLVVGLLLGVAGASFAVALPLASRWYPPHLQGLALGIAGAGNSGTALATFFAPRLAEVWGWHTVFGFALIPVALTFVFFWLMAKDSPTQPAPQGLRAYAAVLRESDTWWFCLFYSVTFGGFVGLASFLNVFFRDQYDVSPVQAGNLATICVIAGSLLRPVGGHLADRLGGIRLLLLLYLGIGVLLAGLAILPPAAWATVLLFALMGCLGMGNGAIFQLVPQRFPKEIGVITGIVGAAGGVGGFFLPNLLGAMKQFTGSFSGGFLVFAVVGVLCFATLARVSRAWQSEFVGEGRLAN